MESVKVFLTEITKELLYNIVYDAGKIHYKDLSKQFEEKTGHRPMDFFSLGNIIGGGWLDFIREIPGLQGKQTISICDDSVNVSDNDKVYKIFNTTYLSEIPSVSVAKYREMILIKCVEIMKHDFSDLNGCEDTNWDTPLHLIAALPGITYNCSTLVKYLLQANVDPLHVNNEGQTILHVIFGRVRAESEGGVLRFKNERVAATKWFVEDRVNLLDTLSEELSEAQMVSLVKAQDLFGETVLHEFALATYDQDDLFHDFRVVEILEILFDFGGSVRVPNDTGEVPFHYASNYKLFKYFLEIDVLCDCRVRNYRDETPVLFLLKLSVDFAFAQTSVSAELTDQAFVQTGNKRSVSGAVHVLDNLGRIIWENVDARETAWIPDKQGNIAIDIVLIAIRIGCYNFEVASLDTASLLEHLVYLLKEMLRNATASDMKRQNRKGQSFLHILLDIGDDNKHSVLTEAKLLQSVEILLQHNVDVNAVDSKGRTPLDYTHLHHDKRPTFSGKCAQLLTKNGAMSNLPQLNEKRKLRSCSERHLNQAQRLTDPNSHVAVVDKYRYFKEFPIGSGAFSSIFVAIKDENVDSKSGTIECRAYALKRLEKAKINPPRD